MASLEKRYGGRYRIVFCWQGKRRYHSLGKMPEREACSCLDRLEESHLVGMEIDAERSGFDSFSGDLAGRPRGLVLAAAREVRPDRQDALPEAGSSDESEWYDLIRTLLFRILDDVDYLAAEIFLDAPPSRSRSMKDVLGIAEDYFTAIPHAPTGRELEAIRADLRRICRRPNAWPAPP